MTYQRFCLTRQVLAEERVGKFAREVSSVEDRAFAASARALLKLQG